MNLRERADCLRGTTSTAAWREGDFIMPGKDKTRLREVFCAESHDAELARCSTRTLTASKCNPKGSSWEHFADSVRQHRPRSSYAEEDNAAQPWNWNVSRSMYCRFTEHQSALTLMLRTSYRITLQVAYIEHRNPYMLPRLWWEAGSCAMISYACGVGEACWESVLSFRHLHKPGGCRGFFFKNTKVSNTEQTIRFNYWAQSSQQHKIRSIQ